MGFPGGASGKRICLPMWKTWVQPLDQEDPIVQEMAPTPVFLPRKFDGQRDLAGYSTWSRKELDTTERVSTHTPLYSSQHFFSSQHFYNCQDKEKI